MSTNQEVNGVEEDETNMSKDEGMECEFVEDGGVISSQESVEILPTTFEDILHVTTMHQLPLKDFLREWTIQLKAADSENGSQKPDVLDVCEMIIEHFPHSAKAESNNWRELIKEVIRVLFQKSKQGSGKAEELLMSAKRSFTSSSKAALFWSSYHKVLNSFKNDLADFDEMKLEEYRLQFSQLYKNIDVDYEFFKSWAVTNSIEREKVLEVQKAFMETGEHGVPLPLVAMEEGIEGPNQLIKWIKANAHSAAPYVTVFPRCEEAVSDNIENSAYWFCYLVAIKQALTLSEASDKLRTLLYSVVRRGLRNISMMLELFLELALNLAMQYLDEQQVVELVAIAETSYNPTNEWTGFVNTRKSILRFEYSLASKNQTNSDVLWDKLKSWVSLLEGDQPLGDFTEVLIIAAGFKRKLSQLSVKKTCEDLEMLLTLNNDPSKHLVIIECIRSQENLEMIQEYYHQGMTTLERQLKQPSFIDQKNRQTYLQLLRNHVQHLYVHGSIEDLGWLLLKISKLIIKYAAEYHESYWLATNVVCCSQYQLYCANNTQNLDYQSNNTDAEVSARLQDVQMDSEEEAGVYRVFLSNIDFKVREVEIKAAFQCHDIEVTKVDLKVIKGRSEGFGTVTVKTQEQLYRALRLDRIQIGKREAFITAHQKKNADKTGPTKVKVKPTVVTIKGETANSSKWAQKDKLTKIVGRYGHIISINFAVDCEENFTTAVIEFKFPQDAENAYYECKEKLVLQDTPLNIRLSYKKKGRDTKVGSGRKGPGKKSKRETRNKRDETTVAVLDQGPVAQDQEQGPAVQEQGPVVQQQGPVVQEQRPVAENTRRFLPEGETRQPLKKSPQSFVPWQFNRQVPRQRLNVPAAAGSAETLPEDGEPPVKKPMTNQEFRTLISKD